MFPSFSTNPGIFVQYYSLEGRNGCCLPPPPETILCFRVRRLAHVLSRPMLTRIPFSPYALEISDPSFHIPDICSVRQTLNVNSDELLRPPLFETLPPYCE